MAHGACTSCGCAREECECVGVSDVRESAAETLRRVNRLLVSLRGAEAPRQPARPALRVGMWVRITKGALWRGEGRLASIRTSYVTLMQLNGNVLTVPRDVVEEAALGTTWESVVDQLGERL